VVYGVGDNNVSFYLLLLKSAERDVEELQEAEEHTSFYLIYRVALEVRSSLGCCEENLWSHSATY